MKEHRRVCEHYQMESDDCDDHKDNNIRKQSYHRWICSCPKPWFLDVLRHNDAHILVDCNEKVTLVVKGCLPRIPYLNFHLQKQLGLTQPNVGRYNKTFIVFQKQKENLHGKRREQWRGSSEWLPWTSLWFELSFMKCLISVPFIGFKEWNCMCKYFYDNG